MNMTCDVNGIRRGCNAFCTKDELDSIKLIRNKVSCAIQALDPRTVPVPTQPPSIAPKEVQDAYQKSRQVLEEQVRMFVKGCLDAKAEAVFLESDWWAAMIEKYHLVGNTFIDFSNGEFYHLVDTEGNILDSEGRAIQQTV
jgi:hypothetical protein